MNSPSKEVDKISCANCAFFDKFPVQKRTDNVLGACKANPPFPASYSNIDQYLSETQDKPSKLGIWPLVRGDFWCGVFTPNDELVGEKK